MMVWLKHCTITAAAALCLRVLHGRSARVLSLHGAGGDATEGIET